MSKKKATMTLKDFHGGSIPSDLPLPSAPGVMVRPADRGGFDRQMSWGNSVGKSDNRLRPASAGSARNIDDKTPFLSHNAPIGRNFDEDERKPLDGASGPRRTVSDDNIRAQPSRVVEPKMDNISGTRASSRPASVQVSHVSSDSMDSSYAGRRNEVHSWGLSSQNFSGSGSAGMNYQNVGVNTGQPVAGSYPNAWALRKETATVKEPVFAAWSAPDAASKLAHASALEKVSSGRWNSKEHVHSQKDVEVLGHAETKANFLYKGHMHLKNNFNRIDVVDAVDYHDIALAMHAEKSLVVDDVIRSGEKEVPPYERLKPTAQMESHERNPSVNTSGYQLLNAPGKSVGTEFHSSLPSEPERPKLKLLPRSTPLENLESQVDYKQGFQQPSFVPVEDSHGVDETKNSAQSAFAGSVLVDQALERPKLNLKPRTQHLEKRGGKNEIERGTVFGGARPREVILKERGMGDVSKGNYDSQPPSRVKEVAPKADIPIHSSLNSEKGENVMVDQQKVVMYTDRRDHPVNGEWNDLQMKNRRNEIRKNNRDVEKPRNQQQQQQQLQDRPPSPETWRKPVEDPNPASPDAPSLRYGKTASAVELAQAFSKSVSDQTRGDNFSGPKGLQRPGQVPFSRLTGPTPRPQINGY